MGKFRQFQTTIACSLFSLIMGLLNVWPSYTIGLYKETNTTLLLEPMTDAEISLLGSLPSLGGMVGTAITSVVIDSLGRKRGGIVFALPYVICWTMIQFTKSSLVILTARFIGGIGGGSGLVYASIYISEIADSSIRGLLTAAPIIFYCLGALISYILGWTCTYRTILYVNLVSSAVCATFVTVIVESPVYLLKKNREKEAQEAIASYRGESKDSKEVLEELSRLRQQICPAVEMITVSQVDPDTNPSDPEKEKLNITEVVYGDQPKMSTWKLLPRGLYGLVVSPSSRRAMIVVGTTLTLQVFMGIVPTQVYANDLFSKAAPDLSSHMCSVLLALVLLGGATLTALFADKAGRRILQLSSCILVAVCMIALGIFQHFRIEPAWLSAVSLLIYCFCFSAGAGTVPYVLLAECFHSEVQGIASMLLVEWVWFLNFFIIAVFPVTVSILGQHGVFYLYAVFAITNCVISYFIVPETKGLTSDQIQESFLKSVKRK